MKWIRPRTAVIAVGILVALIGVAAYVVVRSQSDSREELRDQLAQRATQAGRFTTTALLGPTQRVIAKTYFAGPASNMAASIADYQGKDPLPRVVVLNAQGRVLGADPPLARRKPQLRAKSPALRAGLRGVASLSDVFTAANGQRVLDVVTPYQTRYGPRVVATAAPVADLEASIGGYLPTAPALPGGRAYLLDSRGQVLASSTGAPPGRGLRDRTLRAELSNHTSGNYGDRYFVSVPAGSGSGWRMVFTVPAAALYAPVDGSTMWVTWLLFAGFVLALLVLLVVGATAVYRSARLAHERLHDPLTGLPTRALFLDRVDRALAGVHRRGRSAALIFIDIDRFKQINDSLGHAAGDTLLQEVADRLRGLMRWMDTASRFGGDEFVVLCDELESEKDALQVATRIQQSLLQPVSIGDREVSVECSIGIAMHDPDDTPATPVQLVHEADVAMYRAKGRGGHRVEFFGTGLLEEAAVLELDAETALRAAVGAGGLQVQYRPIVSLPSGDLCGIEAQPSWQRPEHGLLGPDEFIPLAESAGMTELIGEWLVRAAVLEVSAWSREALIDDNFLLSIHVPTQQLSGSTLPASVRGALRVWDLPPTALALEISESALVNEPAPAKAMIGQLHDLGVRVSINLGTDAASMAGGTGSLPIDYIKLDASSATAVTQPNEPEAIVDGLETPDQMCALSELGYSLAQGELFGPALDGARFRVALPVPLALAST